MSNSPSTLVIRRYQRAQDPDTGKLATTPAGQRPEMHIIAFGPLGWDEAHTTDPAAVTPYLASWPVTWINLEGAPPPDMLAELAEVFTLHPMLVEDLQMTQERAKVEEYPDYTFLVARMISAQPELVSEQLSMIIGKNFVVTLQEKNGSDCFSEIRKRTHTTGLPMTHHTPAFLAYYLLSELVDAYFPILEGIGEYLEDLEDQISLNPQTKVVSQLHNTRRELITMRRAIWPLRDALNKLNRDTTPFGGPELAPYLRDVQDHALRVIELLETDRELCADLMDFYLSAVGQRTNDVMKVLTIISTIFLPLTFIAGVYGMNFNTSISPWNMPELNWPLGYPFALLLMALLAFGLLAYYRWRKML